MDGNDTPLAETMRDADAVVDAALGSDRDPVTVGQQLARERARQAIFGTTPSTQVERFTLLEEVGRGGMGVVFAAYDPKLDRRVAIKLVQVSEVPKTDAGARGDTDDRILAEARAMAKISDPNVVTVYEVGHYAPADASTRPAVFVAMEFVQGQTLREWVQSGPRSQDEIVTAYLAAARGLSAVHAAGLVHRDFKPDNVMLGDDGRVRVMDFGIARSGLTGEPPVEGSQSLPPSKHIQFATATGNVAGTPGYMAPERFAGKKGDARSDQFAWCIALYEALSGRRPYGRIDLASLVHAMLDDAPVPAPPVDVTIPGYVLDGLERGLAKDPENRFGSMAELITAFQRPARGGRAAPIVAAGALVAAGLGYASWDETRARSELCTGARAELAGTWDEPRAAAIEAAFVGRSAPYAAATGARVARSLEDYASTWASEHRETCLATRVRGEQTETTMERQMACLQRRRVELGALVSELSRIDDSGVDAAQQAVEGLTAAERCREFDFADPFAVTPADPARAQESHLVEQELARVGAAIELGRIDAAREGMASLVPEAEGLADRGILAPVRVMNAMVRFKSGEMEQAVAELSRAYADARTSSRAEVAIKAALLSASMIGSIPSAEATFTLAEHWLSLARTESEASGQPLPIMAKEVQARIWSRQGKDDLAIALTKEVIAHHERECGECFDLVQRYRELANRQRSFGDVAGLVHSATRGLEIAQNLYEDGHPVIADAMMQMGEAYTELGRPAEAEPLLRAALQSRLSVLGPDHPNTSVVRNSLSRVLSSLGRHDEAIEQSKLTIAAFEKSGNTLAVAAGRATLASLYQTQKRWEEALAEFDLALAEYEGKFPDGHPSEPALMMARARTQKKLGMYDVAVAGSREALALAERLGSLSPHRRVMYMQSLTTALRDAGRTEEALALSRKTVPLARALQPGSLRFLPLLTLARLIRANEPEAARALVDEAATLCSDEEFRRRAQGTCDQADAAKTAFDEGTESG